MTTKSKVVSVRKPFDETLHGLLYDLFRAAGVGMSSQQIDLVRDVSGKIANLFQAESKLANIDLLKKYSVGIVKAFDAVEAERKELEKKVDGLIKDNKDQ